MSTGVQTITVSDTVAPMFTMVPMNMTNSADPGECSKANVTWVVSATDNCGTVGVVVHSAEWIDLPEGNHDGDEHCDGRQRQHKRGHLHRHRQ